jgi:hypothetical protein
MVALLAASSVRVPAPWKIMNRWGVPPSWISVPPAPEPLPRMTTPLAAAVMVLLVWNLPGASSTAPRTPFTSGFCETWSMAARMAAVSSAPEGDTVAATGTTGSGTPPPRYPACEKSMMRSPCGLSDL